MNGIGGRTIAEAQENLTHTEFIVWCKFRNKRGSLNQGMRIETALAQFQAFYANCHTRKDAAKLFTQDFAPHMDAREVTLVEAMRTWS